MPFTLTMPKLSPTMEEGVIAKWHKKEGEFVNAGDLLLEITTDKATVEHNALDEGWLRKILVPEGEEAKMNAPIALFTAEEEESLEGYEVKPPEEERPKMDKNDEKTPDPKPHESSTATLAPPAHTPAPPLSHLKFEKKRPQTPASPLAKKRAKEKGLDLSTVRGSGPGGRVTSRDLDKAQPAGVVNFGSEAHPSEPAGAYEEVALTPMRKAIAKRLQESKTFIPHFYVTQTIDALPLIDLRQQLKEHQLHITFNDLIIRAAALALRAHPEMNAGFNAVEQKLIHFKTVDISVAVAIEDGLITPIVRYADFKDLGEISAEVKELAARASEGKLKEEEYRGGSFTVSNLGMFGIDSFVAVINPPQAAILAVGGIVEAPVVRGGQLVAGKTLTLTLSVDHRVIDGAVAAQFLKRMQHLLEQPVALTLR